MPFFTANQIELLPDGVCDLFINMNSLMEMRMEQIKRYLKHIERLTTTGFMSRQWLTWTNPVDGNAVTRDDFMLDGPWQLVLDQIDEIYPEFFNHVWQKSSKD